MKNSNLFTLIKSSLRFIPYLTLFIFTFVFFSNSAYSEKTELSGAQPKYSEVRIYAVSETDFKRMTEAGLIIDHAIRKPGKFLDAWLSDYELNLLRNTGIPFEILIDDWDKYYKDRQKMTQPEIDKQMKNAKETDNVSHSIYGTMGGYLKYSEVAAKLDSMRMEYPQFISVKFSVGSTYQGRSMWAVRVTKNPDAPTGRPEVFYNALVHAREPESMETQMYYFYWLFENYGTDPVATYILNNREIYWMPVFNVDGYVYNETTNPNGGGMWRCNRHGNGSCGWVDLNRNFGIYQFWNSSNGGSSTDSCSGGQNTYRGKSPFSEIETQNYMNFVNSRNFSTAFNAHTYGNYLIKPWAWSDPLTTPDDYKFNQFLSDMSATNNYTTGTPSQTVGYTVRGGTDDWCYNDSAHADHHIFGITPETGNSFWPAQSEIIPLAQNMLFSNQYMSLIAGPYVNPVSKNFNQLTYNAGESGNLKVVFKNKGLQNAANVKITLTPASSNLTIPVQQYSYPVLNSFAADSTVFNFTIGDNVPVNTALAANLKISIDTAAVFSEKVYILIGTGSLAVNDNAEGTFSNWVTNLTWGITTAQSNSPTHSFTDSPSGQYGNNTNNSMTLANAVSITASSVVKLNFFHKYTVEQNYDFCNVEVSNSVDTSWKKIKSYTGTLAGWTSESFDITQYVTGATQIKVRFRLTSDGSVTNDGWYVDDVKLITYNVGPLAINPNEQIPEAYSLQQNYPNPFNPVTVINYQLAASGFVEIKIYDVLGNEVKTLVNQKQNAGSHSVDFDGSGLPSGVYFYRINAGEFRESKSMMLLK